jgi:alkylated DNA repair dioxygenase AlkB
MALSPGQRSLFAGDGGPRAIVDGDMTYVPGWLDPDEADRLLARIVATCAWRQEYIRMYGRAVPVPRITAWHADPGCSYAYSGIEHDPQPWTPVLAETRDRAAEACGARFNSVLVNRYRNGRDGVAWHSDDEPELGPEPVIASVSLGATRRFQVRRRTDHADRHDIELDHGSLLVMHAGSQAAWEHQLPKTAKPIAERINLTFRTIVEASTSR